MTIIEAIHGIDSLKPNGYSQADKVKWLSSLDGMVKAQIIDTHEDGEGITFNGYDGDTDIDTELLVPAPFDDIYIKWLESKIDYTNAEYGKYNNSVTMFNAQYSAYSNHYNRAHMPKGKTRKFFG
jgi:hypothetical protein